MVIDLGDRTEVLDDPPESGPWNRVRQRASYAALLIVAVLATVGASGAAPADPMPLAATLPIGSFAHLLVQNGRAFILDDENGQARLAAYALPDGRPLWSSPVEGESVNANLITVGTSIVVDPQSSDTDGHVVQAFGMADGHLRWRTVASGLTKTSAGLLTVDANIPATAYDAGYRVGQLDPASGRQLWTVPVGSDCSVTFNDMGAAASRVLIKFCASTSGLTVFDLHTGGVRATARFRAPITNASQIMPLVVLDGVIVVSADNHPGLYASAYRTDDLTELWSRSAAETTALVKVCGAQLCLDGLDGVTELDPQTGVTVTGVTVEAPTETRFHPRPGVLEFVVVPADRRTSAVSMFGSDVDIVFNQPEGTAIDVLGYQPSLLTTTWVTEQVGAVFRPLRSLPPVGASCVFTSGYAACTTASDRLSLYRMPV